MSGHAIKSVTLSSASPGPRKTRRRGFTLIEMLVVLTLIALLLTLAAPRYFHSLDMGREAVRRQNLATLRDAIDKFFGDQGRYPDSLDDLVTRHYLREIPIDPVTEKRTWDVVAPVDSKLGTVYDVRPVGEAASASQTGGGG